MWWTKKMDPKILADLLEEERRILLDGDIQLLETLEPKKEKLLRAVAKTEVDPEILADLKARSERNDALLKAARSGLEAARVRIQEHGKSLTFSTYSLDGTSSEMGKARPETLIKRA